ncbi:MAG: hypothetical protein Q8N18_23035 [Opitutaceae bacterium]|nr:hypothetical protein [Opitutaceae bacterium]
MAHRLFTFWWNSATVRGSHGVGMEASNRHDDNEGGPPAWRLHGAGAVAAGAWLILVWRSHTAGGATLGWMLGVVAVAWASLAFAWCASDSGGRGGRVVAVWALGFRLVAFFAQPVLEDDHHRFLWDGHRFAVTGNPYAEPPQARFGDESIAPEFRAVLDRINHPDVATVYGPATQWAFRAAHAVAPAQLWPWKLILLGAELALGVLLWPVLGARGRLLLAWCPLAIFETGFNAHPDALAIALAVVAWRNRERGWGVAAGVALGAAIAAKVFAVLLAPFILWRLGARAWIAAVGAGLACYAPFWLRGSGADLAGLRAMAGEWEFNSSVYALAAAATSPPIARGVCAVAFGAIWAGLFLRWRRTFAQPPPGTWIYGAFLLLSATANPWYALWLWPFVALRPSATGVAVLAAVSLSYATGLNLGDPSLGNFGHPAWLRPVEFGAIMIAAGWDWRSAKKAAREM